MPLKQQLNAMHCKQQLLRELSALGAVSKCERHAQGKLERGQLTASVRTLNWDLSTEGRGDGSKECHGCKDLVTSVTLTCIPALQAAWTACR